jgi:hypothetical protein
MGNVIAALYKQMFPSFSSRWRNSALFMSFGEENRRPWCESNCPAEKYS